MKKRAKSRSESSSSSSSPSSSSSDSDSCPVSSDDHRDDSRSHRGDRSDSEVSFVDTGVRIGTRVHVGSINAATSQHELRRVFERYGVILDMWMARTNPCFAFIVFKRRSQALKAIKCMDGEPLNSRSIHVTMARPRTQANRPGSYSADLRCYQCGRRGHFSRDCSNYQWSPALGYLDTNNRNSYSSDRAHYRDISPRKFRQPARGFHGSRVGLKCSPRGSKTSRDSHSRSRDRTHTRREETSSFDSQPNNR